jgi:hypothetical protein
LKPAKFETYKPKSDEFKVAQLRTNTSYNKNYVPIPHPFIKRLLEHRSIPSLWTPSKPAGDKS